MPLVSAMTCKVANAKSRTPKLGSFQSRSNMMLLLLYYCFSLIFLIRMTHYFIDCHACVHTQWGCRVMGIGLGVGSTVVLLWQLFSGLRVPACSLLLLSFLFHPPFYFSDSSQCVLWKISNRPYLSFFKWLHLHKQRVLTPLLSQKMLYNFILACMSSFNSSTLLLVFQTQQTP